MFAYRLYYHLADTLGRAHDVGGIYRLVRRNLHESFRAEFVSATRDVQRAEHVILYRLVGTGFHKGHVLMRRGVEYYLRSVFGEHVAHLGNIAHAGDKRQQIEFGIFSFKLLLNIVRVVFVNI